MKPIIKISSGAKWEDMVGYSRAVKTGNHIELAGTTAIDDNQEIVGIGDAYGQTKFILQKIEKVLFQLDCKMEYVIRTRIFTTDIAQWEAIGKAHGEFFASIKPAVTMVEVSNLIHPDMLVEIECTAITPK